MLVTMPLVVQAKINRLAIWFLEKVAMLMAPQVRASSGSILVKIMKHYLSVNTGSSRQLAKFHQSQTRAI